jgi:hypothetical protein
VALQAGLAVGAGLEPGWPLPALGTAVAPEGLASTMGPGGGGIGVESNLGVAFQLHLHHGTVLVLLISLVLWIVLP